MVLANVGAPELLIVLAVLVLVFGSTRLPKLARSLGEAATELRRGLGERREKPDQPS